MTSPDSLRADSPTVRCSTHQCLRWNEERVAGETSGDIPIRAGLSGYHRREDFVGGDRAELCAIDIGSRRRAPNAILSSVCKSTGRGRDAFTLEHRCIEHLPEDFCFLGATRMQVNREMNEGQLSSTDFVNS